jgi:hypothetical protein
MMLLYEQEECYMKLKIETDVTHNHLSCDGEIIILVINLKKNKIDTLIYMFVR